MNTNFGVPLNLWGDQFPHSGNGYSQFFTNTTILNFREYIGNILQYPLTKEAEYVFEMYISLAEWSSVSCDQIGVLFTDSNVICPTVLHENLSNCTPQITTARGVIYEDSVNWVKVSGSFIAHGDEQYLTIGFFQENDSINWIYRHDWWSHWVEYYLDDVWLYEKDKAPVAAFAGNDALICRGDSLQLGSTWYLDYSYSWIREGDVFDTTGRPWVWPDSTTTYYLVQTDFKSVTTYDTVTIYVKNCETPANAGPGIEICIGDSIVFQNGNKPDNRYIWLSSKGDTIVPPALLYPDSSGYFILLQWDKYDSLTLDTLIISLKDCYLPITIPNVFTPNGDGRNDVLEILNPGKYNYRIYVYNRWGNIVYNDDGTNHWDGRKDGAPLPEGVYFYTILAITPDNTEVKYSGVVHLLR